MKHPINDEHLVAYVLGELDEAQRAAVEQALAQDEALRKNVAELRASANLAAQALKATQTQSAALSAAQRETIRSQAKEKTGGVSHRRRAEGEAPRRRTIIVPALQLGALAAMILVGMMVVAPRVIERAGGGMVSPFIYTLGDEVAQAPPAEAPAQSTRGKGLTVKMYRREGVAHPDDMRAMPALTAEEFSQLQAVGYMPPASDAGFGESGNPIDDPNKNYWPGHNTEGYDRIVDNPFLGVAQNPLSTFSIDVDTASYSNTRRFLNEGQLPPPDAVRIEEFINYFSYDYAPPDSEDPFAVHVDTASCPWAKGHEIVRIGLKGKEIAKKERPPVNLVFLIDVSGSMQPANKLPLVQRGLKMLVKRLNKRDRIAMAVYAGAAGLVLPSTRCDEEDAILEALDRLRAGGSTNGGQGIQLAYDVAAENFIEGGVNRVILCTDGDFNVGTTDRGSLIRMVEDGAKSGVFLTVLGFGMGNIKDATLEQIADKGNGNYAYIDSQAEAGKVLVEQMTGTLITIAKDVKIQVEFNPAEVNAYRLIGYENRVLAAEDFNDDKKDAGEIGAGHTVTALYEIVPAGVEIDLPSVDPLKYQQPASEEKGETKRVGNKGELLTVKLRYKQPDGDTSKLLTVPVRNKGVKFGKAAPDLKFAASVAGFGMLLRDSEHKGSLNFDKVLRWAKQGSGEDPNGYRQEFVSLVHKAKSLKSPGM